MARIADLMPAETQNALQYIAIEETNRKIVVTNHAIARFLDWRRRGMLRPCSGSAEARTALTRIALRGRPVRRLPGGAFEVEDEKGLRAVMKKENGALIVLTFNGNREWSGWWRNQRRLELGRWH